MLYTTGVSKIADSVWWRPGLGNVDGKRSGKWEQFQGRWRAVLRWFGEAESSDDTKKVRKVCALSMKVLAELQETDWWDL